MTKKRILLLLLVCLISLLALCSCNIVDSTGEVADSISLVATDMNVEVGSFDPSNYYLLVSYNTGRTEKVQLTQDMIPETELTKFYQFGSKTVNIEAYGLKCEATFNITRKQIKDVYIDGFTYNQKSDMYFLTTYYTGTDKVISVAGDIPAGSSFSYPQGNTFKKVGSYDFVVYISCENYETKKLIGNITINKAKYDLSDVKFADIDDKNICEKTYDGTRKEMSITGTLPQGVKVSYKIQSSKSGEQFEDFPINAGNYYVYATFESDLVSYEPIPDMIAYLIIAKKQIKLDDVNFEDQEITYDGKSHTFLLTNESLISSAEGPYHNLLDFKYENNVQTNAGKYIVKANIYPKDSTNYEIVKKAKATEDEGERYEVITQLSAYATIAQASYDVSFITLDNDTFQYDGKVHALSATFAKGTDGKPLSLPDEVKMFYENNSKTDAGTYEVYLKFTHNNKNYAQIEPIKASMRILPLKIDMTDVTFDLTSHIFTYDGTVYTPKLIVEKLPSQIKEVSYKYISSTMISGESFTEEVDKCQNAASYALIASFTSVEKNYEIPAEITDTFTIVTRMISDADIQYQSVPNNVFEYDGTKKHLDVISSPFDSEITYSIVDKWNFEIDDPTLPGKYYQITSFNYFNGLENTTYNANPVEIEVRFTIDDSYFEYSNSNVTYSGKSQAPTFSWSTSNPRYSLLKDEFKEIYYQYKEYGEPDSEYSAQAPVETGQYVCKAVFSEYVSFMVADARAEYITVVLTISKVTISWTDIMQFSLNDTEYMAYRFGDLTYYDTKTSSYAVKPDVYFQEYEIVYDGRSRTIKANEVLSQLGELNYDITYSYGDCENDNYYQTNSATELFDIKKTGLYVIKIDFEASSNANMTVENDMYLVIKYNLLRYDEDVFSSQNVYKANSIGTAFDISGISAILNPNVIKYEYGSTITYKPLSYEEANNVDYYYAYLEIMFDETDSDIDASSFALAVANSDKGIESIDDDGTEFEYKKYTFKIKVNYV